MYEALYLKLLGDEGASGVLTLLLANFTTALLKLLLTLLLHTQHVWLRLHRDERSVGGGRGGGRRG